MVQIGHHCIAASLGPPLVLAKWLSREKKAHTLAWTSTPASQAVGTHFTVRIIADFGVGYLQIGSLVI
jgi:hypothetical protein